MLFLVSSATVIVRSGGLFWWNPIAMVLFMLCRVVAFEAMLCGDMWGVVFVMYGSNAFSSVLLSLREVRWSCMMCLCLCFVWFWNWYDVC